MSNQNTDLTKNIKIVNKDQPNKDQPNKDQPNKDQPNKDQPNKDQPNKDQPNKDQPNKNQPNKDQPNKNQPNKNQCNEINHIIVLEFNSSKSTYSVFHMIVSLFAIYLSFKCNNDFDLSSFLMACFFPYFYIIYKFVKSENFCGIKNVK